MEIQQPHQLDQYPLSRRVAPFGYETQVKLMRMRVFIHGLSGLGIEIAKNLALMSLKEITIFDNNIVTMKDVGRNFACRQHHIGKMTRAEVGVEYLKELNANCRVKVTQNDNIDFIASNYDCVVVVDNYNKDYLQRLNIKCRENNVGFILAGCLGLYGYTFVDFGNNYLTYDPRGEQLKEMTIRNITKSQHGVVQLLQYDLHNLNDGDVVEFENVQGMTELNGKRCVVYMSQYQSFEIVDTRRFTPYIRGGTVKKVKIPLKLQFKSLQQSLMNKQTFRKSLMTISNSVNWNYSQQLHFILNGMYDFFEQYNRLPRICEEKDALQLFLSVRRKRSELFSSQTFNFDMFDVQLIRTVSMYANTQISPMCSFWGGIAAQQVVKFTGKYTPIHQWMHHQFFDALPQNQNIPRTLLTENNRYNDYITLFGDDFFKKIQQLNLLLVGAGSVGGECLKTMSLMGVGTGKKGKITVLDDKKVLKRNLNSHFLLKNQDVGLYKAQCVAQAVKQLNPSIKVDFLPLSLEKQSEEFVNDDLWQGLDFVIGAIGNLYTIQNLYKLCVWNEKPLSLGQVYGTECSSHIIIPNETSSAIDVFEHYDTGADFNERFDFSITQEITKEWVNSKFYTSYESISSSLNMMFTQPQKLFDRFDRSRPDSYYSVNAELMRLKLLYQINERKSFQGCVQLIIGLFHEFFITGMDRLVTLVIKYSKQMSQGGPWHKRQRQPEVLELYIQNPLHLQFIQAGANIFAQMMNIPLQQQAQQFLKIAHSAIQTSNYNSYQKTNNQPSEMLTDEQKLINLKQSLNELMSLPVRHQDTPIVIKLDLENPNKWHTKFIEAAFQLRSLQFGIKSLRPEDYFLVAHLKDEFQAEIQKADDFFRLVLQLYIQNYQQRTREISWQFWDLQVKPKIVTTTAVLAGLIGMNMINYQLKKPIDQQKNIIANIAFSSFNFNPPNPPNVIFDNYSHLVVPREFTQWTIFNIKQPMLLCQLIQYLGQTYNIKVTQIIYEGKTVYDFYEKFNSRRRLVMRVEDAVSQVIKKKICRIKKKLLINVIGERDGTDCVLPLFRYHFTNKSQGLNEFDL